ncbi:hypothetical protein [Croceibacter atlanticus]|uniref:Uncharacterized protein n=1 Tax=Croceibacter atlanticus (strain ATCC BAA-628 / JCM 21780 / CIP 108009 / IAM 15332 / KCTC 12090 / HTCC2559) TaxID=216432 RepID=A3U4J1_CROAH|nr:hypothetical protein [Croceibacter atlanticus]EAP87158.1 hypothetical protein CA2559_00345 [Croceibacter atlanticus HTCC2559]
MKEVPKKDKKKLKKAKSDTFKIVLTALLTSMFTGFVSYFLMFSQLKEEQNYWKTRTKAEKVSQLLEKQIEIFDNVNSGILLTEVLAKDFKLYSAKFMSTIELSLAGGKNSTNEESEILNNKAIEYHKQINQLATDIQMSEMYFGAKVDSLINPLSESLNSNYQNNLILGDTTRLKGYKNVTEYFKRDFNTTKELSENRLKILKAMRSEIDSTAEILYGDYLKN